MLLLAGKSIIFSHALSTGVSLQAVFLHIRAKAVTQQCCLATWLLQAWTSGLVERVEEATFLDAVPSLACDSRKQY